MSLSYSPVDSNSMKEKNLRELHDKYMNGRVTFTNKPTAPFELFQGENVTVKTDNRTTLEHSFETTPVNKLFFSKNNVDYIHQRIINDVFIKSNKKYKISRQSDTNLTIRMRSFYLQYGRNMLTDIQGQVNELNEMVIQDCVKDILSEIEQKMFYIQSISKLPEQMSHPVNSSSKGEKILYSNIGR